jgi:hypothetical protein
MKTEKVKLTKVQKEVVELMKNNWQLGESSLYCKRRVWLQLNGIGKGGDHKKVSHSTFAYLKNKNVIEIDQSKFPTSTYKLTKDYL